MPEPSQETAVWALKTATAQRHLDHQHTGPVGRKRHARHGDTRQVEQTVE
jgi:hypothetical protein